MAILGIVIGGDKNKKLLELSLLFSNDKKDVGEEMKPLRAHVSTAYVPDSAPSATTMYKPYKKYSLVILLTELFKCTAETCILHSDLLSCRGHLPEIPSLTNVKALELCDVEWETLDFNTLLFQFPNIEVIKVNGKHLRRILPPSQENKIKTLQLSHLHIRNISKEFLEKFSNLETLILTGNELGLMRTNFSFPIPTIRNVYLSDNKWNCSENLDWVLNLNKTIIKDYRNMTCHEGDFVNKPLGMIAKYMRDVRAQCPLLCRCALTYVSPRCPMCDKYDPIIEVDCSSLDLDSLPASIPMNTTTLKLDDNNIEDLRPLVENPLYLSVRDLHIDFNRISSIEVLEGTYWLAHFRIFSVRGNRLTEIPTYALENALEQNPNMPAAVRINFEENPWRCDCIFTPGFQELLRKYATQIRDLNKIKCSYVEGDENSLLPIIDLSRSSFCRVPSEYSIQALDLLNIVLASLIVLILGKLAYDYYHFKKTGKLPWIVTKMP